MVLTKSELIGALKHEVRILQHLTSKIEPSMVDYRPTSNQRSTIELLRYLTIMGPTLVKSALAGGFDMDEWGRREQASTQLDFNQTVAALAAQADEYEAMLKDVPDSAFRKEVEMFGQKFTVGLCIVSLVLGGCAAYRTQLFCYLKACGRSELSTMNLWAGIDAPVPATT